MIPSYLECRQEDAKMQILDRPFDSSEFWGIVNEVDSKEILMINLDVPPRRRHAHMEKPPQKTGGYLHKFRRFIQTTHVILRYVTYLIVPRIALGLVELKVIHIDMWHFVDVGLFVAFVAAVEHIHRGR